MVKRSLSTCTVSPEANVSHLPFTFFSLSGFSTLLVPTCLLRLFTQDFYHGTTMIDNTKTRLSLKAGMGNVGMVNGNGESLKAGIFKMGNL